MGGGGSLEYAVHVAMEFYQMNECFFLLVVGRGREEERRQDVLSE